MKSISKVLIILPILVFLIGCEVEPPVTPTNPTFYDSPPVEADTMSVSYDLETTEPLVWVGTVEVEARGTRLVEPSKMELKTTEGQYRPYLFDDPATLQPGQTMTFSVTYKVENTLEKPTSILLY